MREQEQPSSLEEVFISYYKEDAPAARRLYLDLKAADKNPWLDTESLLPGHHRSIKIKEAIRNCRYFIPLISNNSIKARGDVVKQLNGAFEVAGGYLDSDVYVVPARLDDCEPPYEQLREIEYANMFPDWYDGLKKILKVMEVKQERIELIVERQQHMSSSSSFSSRTTTTVATESPIFKGEKIFFVGRDEYFNRKIIDKLKTPNSLVSIVGPAGSGKSQLAFKAIRKSMEQDIFDLVIRIYLDAGVISYEIFLSEMAGKLGLNPEKFETENTSLEQRKNRIKELLHGKRHPLVYVDHYDTISSIFLKGGEGKTTEEVQKHNISDTDKERIYQDALKIHYLIGNNFHTNNTSILLTSRRRNNNLVNEQLIDLLGLNMEERIELFNGYVRDLHLKNPKGTVKRQIDLLLERTGGHPLSIEIIAKNVKNLSEIEELSENLGHPSENLDEQKTIFKSLQSCFEYTIGKLPKNLQYLLYKLVLFKSPFPISAPVEIFEAEERDILDLYDCSLLTLIQSDEVYGNIYDSQYWLYSFDPAARNYLESTVDTFNNNVTLNLYQAKCNERYSLYYCRLLSDTCNSMGKENYRSSLARFNVIYRGNDNDFERAMKITTYKQLSAEISSNLGHVVAQLGRLSKALEYHRTGFEIYKGLDDKYGMTKGYADIGLLLMDSGRFIEALDNHKKALEINEQLNDRTGMTLNYNNIGNVLEKMCRFDEALDNHKKALEINEQLNDRTGMTLNYNNIGNVLEKMGNYQEALDYHKKALEINEQLNDRTGMTLNYNNIGTTLLSMRRLDEALEYHKKALQIDEKELNDRIRMARDYYEMNFVHVAAGNKREALICLLRALERLEEFRTETNYHHPLIDEVNKRLSFLNRI